MNNKSKIHYIKGFLNKKKRKKIKIIKTTTTVRKISLNYSLMSEGNTCIAEPNLEVLLTTTVVAELLTPTVIPTGWQGAYIRSPKIIE